MTHTDINKVIHKKITGKDWYGGFCYKCKKDLLPHEINEEERCTICNSYVDMEQESTSYDTPDGNQLIFSWLVKEDEVREFWRHITGRLDFTDDYSVVEAIDELFKTALKPEQFAQKFYDYIV